MRILITNDDGIWAPGLKVLAEIAVEIAGPDGEVWTVAPAFEQSGVGHCISYVRPMLITQNSDRSFAVEGSPADCVLAAFYEVFQGDKPDLVLSGVNKGNNAAENTLYSGTIGATIEAAMHGVNAIALSQFYGPESLALEDQFEASRLHGAEVVRQILASNTWNEDQDYRLFYNVNFPPVAAKNVKGTKIVSQGFRRETDFSIEPTVAPNGRKFLWIKGGAQHHPTADGTDVHANVNGYISVTPMRCDLTAHDTLPKLQAAFSQ